MKTKKFMIAFIMSVVLIISIIVIVIAVNNRPPVYPKRDITQYHNIDFSNWKDGKLIVNDKECEDITVKIHSDGYSVVPFVRIVEEMGGTVEWKNDTIAIVKCKGIKYKLDLDTITLTSAKVNDYYNLFALNGYTECEPYFYKDNDEFYVGDDFIRGFLSILGECIETDYTDSLVKVYANPYIDSE